MQRISGGPFWVGTKAAAGASDESPRFKTAVAGFCLDTYEVTVDQYKACTEKGSCKPARDERRFCNLKKSDRGKHPINCVDWYQADAYCKARDARLPTEVEWEYAARGGEEYRQFSWGSEAPDGRTCWKHVGGSCEIGQYAAGAFGLYDMTGNVWEWTDTWFGEYPWPPLTGDNKVYRGGSWSRRFTKWMSTKLRNRYRPKEWGSHLGFRCARTLPGENCPFGRADDGKQCLFGVTELDCPPGQSFNGVRCAGKDAAECPAGRVKKPGHGCVLEHAAEGPFTEGESSPVNRVRTAEFDSDCDAHYPGRPHSYRYSGGTHAKRNHVSHSAGCANRDVGVGWNSTCCP